MSVHVSRVTRLDADRAVLKLDVDCWHFGSVFVVGLSGTSPRVSWPKTQRGFPIVECKDKAHLAEIEETILDAVAAA
jgi:hypothetical protein